MVFKTQFILLISSVPCYMFFYRGKMNSRSCFLSVYFHEIRGPPCFRIGGSVLGVVLLGAFLSCNGHRT